MNHHSDESGEVYRDQMGPGLAIVIGLSCVIVIVGGLAGAIYMGLRLMRLY